MNYHISWLEEAIKNFKLSENIHMLDGNMTILDFMIKYSNFNKAVKMN